MAYTDSFRVTAADAKQILREVLDATSDWQRVATDNGVATSELPRFTDTFEGLRGPLERLTAKATVLR
jgi:serine/threonine-protein kinase HipA